MENNEITTKEKLKTYFETGKYPTENQFAELIDFFSLKEGTLTNKELVTLANGLASLNNGYILYNTSNIENEKFQIVVSSKEGEDQIFTIGKTENIEQKRYFQGSAPYTVRTKEFLVNPLEGHRYYYLNTQVDDGYTTSRLFGNNLPPIPENFGLGTVDNKKFSVRISNEDFDRKITNLHTRLTFINKTEVLIEYALYGNYWSNKYISEDIVTDHYNLGDFLVCSYRADLTEISKPIRCRIYDEDNGILLMEASLVPGQKNINASAGGVLSGVRNARIECDYES